MDATDYFEEIDQFVKTYRLKVEDEKKEIAESQKKLSNLVKAFSQKASTSSVINSLFKDDEPNGFVFSKQEEKRKQLAEQRRAEYNAYLEKKEAERLSKRRVNGEKNISPKSILDSVDYERVLAKRKEEEARFRNLNIADILHHSQPILNGEAKKPDLNTPTTSYVSPRSRSNSVSMPTDSLSKAPSVSHEINNKYPEPAEKKGIDALSKEDVRLLEERIAKQLEEQRCQMLLQFENELRKNNEIQEELQSMKSSSSVKSSPRRRTPKSEDFPNFGRTPKSEDFPNFGRTPKSEDFPNFGRTAKSEDFPNFGRTGGGGEPVRDSYGNLLAMRGQRRNGSADYGSIMSFPSMQQQPVKDKMTLYREELQKQIEEKKRLEALERAKEREQEEKFAQRIEEQRLKMLEEYENELKKNKAKEQFQRQQERIRIFEEFQKRDAEARRKKVPEVKPPSPVPEKVQPPPVVQERSNSPPIPAVRTKVLLEKAVEAVPKVVKPENTFSSLAEIRRKIMEEQKKPQNNLKKSYEVMNRRTVQEISDDEEDDILKTSTNSYQYST